MAKLILFNMLSADGFFEGKNRELDWHTVDSEFIDFSIEQLRSADTLIFGRVTYNLMVNYWTNKEVEQNDPIVYRLMNSLDKVVFSTTLSSANWENTKLYHGQVKETVGYLKQKSQMNILVLGSANLTNTLSSLGVIDEYRFMISPIILGQGNSLFANAPRRSKLNLIAAKSFKSGNVLLRYEPNI
jgi:dihydrofolate reductase